MYCRKCGKQIPDDSIYCFSCGLKVQDENELNSNSNNDGQIEDQTTKKPPGIKAKIIGIESGLRNAIIIFSIITPILTTFIVLIQYEEFNIPFFSFQIVLLIFLSALALKISDGKLFFYTHFALSILTGIPILFILDFYYHQQNYKKRTIDFEILKSDLDSSIPSAAFYLPKMHDLANLSILPKKAVIKSDMWLEIDEKQYRRIAYTIPDEEEIKCLYLSPKSPSVDSSLGTP
jgi:hypothetical protein